MGTVGHLRCTFGAIAYLLRLEGDTLFYNSTKLETLEQQTDQMLHTLENASLVLGDQRIAASICPIKPSFTALTLRGAC